jgi:hypothetical protein
MDSDYLCLGSVLTDDISSSERNKAWLLQAGSIHMVSASAEEQRGILSHMSEREAPGQRAEISSL